MSDWTAALLSGLRQAGLTAEPEDVADSLWLALKMRAACPVPLTPVAPPVPEPAPATVSPPDVPPSPPPESSSAAPAAPVPGPSRPAADRVPLHLPTRKEGAAAGGGRTFFSPAARALPDSLALLRALRPLMRRVPSRDRLVLDEAETVRRVAEEGIWMPAVRPARERWLRLCLVVDAGASMGLWNQAVAELFKLLHGSGAFLHVAPWTLDTERIPRLYAGLRPRPGVARGRSPRELIDPSGRSAILVLSDCVGASWYDGRIAGVLEEWGRCMPLAVVQVLPEHLWARTALGGAERVLLSPSGVAVPNLRLRSQREDWPGGGMPEGVPLPVLTLEPAALSAWARLLVGHPEARLPGVTLAAHPPPVPELPAAAEVSPKERVERFWRTASPPARKLAGLLAAAPVISLPVLRLIRQALLPQARQVHEAEVLLGGLLCVTDDALDADEVRYDLHSGVRELLLDAVPTPSMLSVLERVSRYVESHLGMGTGFRALLLDPALAAGAVVPSDGPFARVAAEVLERLGGDYARLVRNLPVSEATSPANTDSTLTPSHWILVIGGGDRHFSETLQSAIQVVVQVLLEGGYGLVSGGWPGVDQAVTSVFAAQLMERGVGPVGRFLRQVLIHDWLFKHRLAVVVPPVRQFGDPPHEPTIRHADVVMVIDGEDGAWEAADCARALGKPVLPLASTGGAAARLHRETLEAWDRLAPPSLSRKDYRQLGEPITAATELARLLRAVLSPKQVETSSRQDQPHARSPRVQITCEVKRDGGTERRELPFVVGVLADLAGNTIPRRPVRERSFLFAGIDRDHFDLMLRYFAPRLALEVPSHLSDIEGPLQISLAFHRLEDFEPEGILLQVGPLARPRRTLAQLQAAERAKLSMASWGGAYPGPIPKESADYRDRFAREISEQLREILHHPAFQRLEATWRGLHYLVQQSETGADLKIRLLNVSKEQLREDLTDPAGVEQSLLYETICADPFGKKQDGEPFSLLVGDYEFDHSPDDIALLSGLSRVAAAAHAPFVASASARMFGLTNFTDLPSHRGLEKLLSEPEYAAWNSFRDSEESGYTVLTLPRTLARLPYQEKSVAVEDFKFDEMGGRPGHNRSLWMSATWAYAVRIAATFTADGWFARIHGIDGGQVKGLPVYSRGSGVGTAITRGPLEVSRGELQGINLSRLGFLPLVCLADPDFTGFLSAQSCRKASDVAARLDYRLCVSRFVHCVMLMARNRAGSFATLAECEHWLNEWISGYVLSNPSRWEDDLPSRCPLAEARIELREREGALEVLLLLRPHYQLASPAESVRVVATIPRTRR